MKKYIFIGLFILVLIHQAGAIPISAYDKHSEESAQIMAKSQSNAARINSGVYQIKKTVIAKVLADKNSPLTQQADAFVATAYKYNIDPYLLPSISWLESSLGTRLIKESNNPFGYGSGRIYWNSFEEGIEVVSKALAERYYGRGAKTIYDVGRIYAASPTWAIRVEKFMNHFYNEEGKLLKIQNIVSDTERS